MLWNLGLTRLDSVYLSHADQDHYNALPDLLDRFQIGELVIPSGFVNEQNPGASLLLDQVRTHGIPVRTIAAPSTWNQGSTQFTVLHPPPDWHPETPDNARSLVLDVAHGGRHLLLTGDLDQLGLVELVAQAQPEPIDLMLAPHHGGKSANPSWLYSWARPRAVIVSQRPSVSGTTDALTPLERGGIPLLRTWERGAIHFRWSSDRILTQGFLESRRSPPACRSQVSGQIELTPITPCRRAPAAGTNQARSFSSASAPARDEAGFWPVTSLPSVTTKIAQSAAFS